MQVGLVVSRSVVEDGGGWVVSGELLLLLLWRWRVVEEYGPMRRSLSSVGGVDITAEASCNNSVKVMICGK